MCTITTSACRLFCFFDRYQESEGFITTQTYPQANPLKHDPFGKYSPFSKVSALNTK